VGEKLNLSNLQPAQTRKDRKRVGRGPGSGKGKFSGRGVKGQKSRSGSHKMRAGFEGGQMPIYMRIGKLRGSTSKDAMPVGPFRTETAPINLRDLERFESGDVVTPESLVEKRLLKNTKIDVKLLGTGEVSKKLTIRVHAISASAREKIEAAGGTIDLLREPKAPKRKKHHKEKPAPAPAAAAAAETPADEAEPDEAADETSTDQASTDQGSETPEA
jgi:large subunit ribosomal protein L15